jgi:hypothetical protein
MAIVLVSVLKAIPGQVIPAYKISYWLGGKRILGVDK